MVIGAGDCRQERTKGRGMPRPHRKSDSIESGVLISIVSRRLRIGAVQR